MTELIVNDPKNLLWVEKYRPTRVRDCILPERFKRTFQQFVDDGAIPNLLLVGGPGVGKTTVLRAMYSELDVDYIMINGSMNGDIGTLRNEIQNFASTVSFGGGRKAVCLDEMDYLNPNSTQPALRNFMEEFSKNCGFQGTANYKQRIIQPLHSRMSVIELNLAKKELPELASAFLKRTEQILKTEGVEYDKKAVAAVIAKHFPDWRRVLNELQRYAASGMIDSGILTDISEEKFKSLVSNMKSKDFGKVRSWVAENEDLSASDLYRAFYDQASGVFAKNSIPQMVLILANYQEKEAFVADTQINRAACFVEIMADCEFL